jgi:hypothetical protein
VASWPLVATEQPQAGEGHADPPARSTMTRGIARIGATARKHQPLSLNVSIGWSMRPWESVPATPAGGRSPRISWISVAHMLRAEGRAKANREAGAIGRDLPAFLRLSGSFGSSPTGLAEPGGCLREKNRRGRGCSDFCGFRVRSGFQTWARGGRRVSARRRGRGTAGRSRPVRMPCRRAGRAEQSVPSTHSRCPRACRIEQAPAVARESCSPARAAS